MRYLVFATGPQGFGKRGAELRHQLAVVMSGEVRARVEVVALATYEELRAAVDRGTAGLAWMPPGVYVSSRHATPLARSVRAGTASFRGALFVPAWSEVLELEHLSGRTVAWVDPYSCAGHLFPRWQLTERGIDVDVVFGPQRFLGSHGAVARAVLDGQLDVGAGYAHVDTTGQVVGSSWLRLDPKANVRVLLVTPPVPSDIICASASLDPGLIPVVRLTLRDLRKTAEGREIMDGLFQCSHFDEDVDHEEYALVRRACELFDDEPSTLMV
jgi:phosphonate transport system substrate-binding protein